MTKTTLAPARILVVDDEPKNRELLRHALESRDYVVEEATSGAEAFARIAAAPPDVVLLDVAMPGTDGLDVCRHLKSDPGTARLPVLMVTAFANRRIRIAAIEAGANDYVTKPVDVRDLVLRVRNAVAVKRLDDEVRDQLRRLQELEGLRDNLTHMIIHDLRSPLAAMMMAIEMWKAAAAAVPGRESELKLIESSLVSARRMEEMITTLLDVSRLEAGEMPLQKSPAFLAPLVNEVLDTARTHAANRQIALVAPTGGTVACCDAAIVRRILANLVGNACKFTPPGGIVRVALTAVDSVVRVAVRDNGPGIAPEHHQKIFEKFGQVGSQNARAGTGLGLAFCKLAVEAHGGRIGVESTVGNGSTFWFTLPAA